MRLPHSAGRRWTGAWEPVKPPSVRELYLSGLAACLGRGRANGGEAIIPTAGGGDLPRGTRAAPFVYVKGLSAEIDPSSALTPVSGSLHQLAESEMRRGCVCVKRPGVVVDQPMESVDKARAAA